MAELGILVVDDEVELGKMLERCLRDAGFKVYLATSGQQGLDLYRQHHPDIALALLDVQLPDLDGPGLLTVLRQWNPDLEVCFMSGDTGLYPEEELRQQGRYFFRKPFSLLEVLSTLRNLAARVPAAQLMR